MGVLAALLDGPAWIASGRRGPACGLTSRLCRGFFLAPFFLLSALVFGAALTGASADLPARLVAHIVPVVPMATLTTLLCLLLVALVVPTQVGVAWLLPAWFGFGPGLTAWSLAPVQRGSPVLVCEVACLLLPVGIVCLGRGRAPSTLKLQRAAASSGAGAATIFVEAVLKPQGVRLVRAGLIVAAFSAGLLAMAAD